jgi:hypothetical protein
VALTDAEATELRAPSRKRVRLLPEALRSELWARIDRRVTHAAPWVLLVTPVATSLVSERIGNYQFHPQLGPLHDQLWVR